MSDKYKRINGQLVYKICLNCGTRFPLKRDTRGKYCSNPCWIRSPEHDEVVRRALKGKKRSAEDIEKSAAPRRGTHQSKEVIKKRMAFWKEGFTWKPETIKKRAESNRGQKRTGAELKKIQDSVAKSYGYSSYAELKLHPRKNYRIKYEVDQKVRASERDQNVCLLCGIQENLEVHHIIDVRRFPVEQQDNTAHNLRNLITLCRTHHKELIGFKKKSYIDTVFELQELLALKYGYVYDWVSTRSLLNLPIAEKVTLKI